jgi:hypothetical protein
MIVKTFSRTFTDREISLMRISVFLLFIGRAWQGMFFDLPLRTFFWDEKLLEGIVTLLTGDSWQNYVTNKSVNIDLIINRLGMCTGIFWALMGFLSLRVQKDWKWSLRMMKFAAFTLIILSLLYYKDRFFAVGQLLEYSIQVAAPLVLIYAVSGKLNTQKIRLVLRIVIAVSFICHGLYAYGYYPLPGLWVQWSMDVFFISDNDSAAQFLKIAGLLDFLAAAALFFLPTLRMALYYCIIWGTLTAIARIYCNFYYDFALQSLHQHAFETSYRLVHGAMPLFLLWCCKNEKT